jgi:hypothetical protein
LRTCTATGCNDWEISRIQHLPPTLRRFSSPPSTKTPCSAQMPACAFLFGKNKAWKWWPYGA